MNILEINPYIRRAMQSELSPMSRINRRIILDYELLYVESGEFLLTYNENEYLCKKGDILLLCPGIPHSFQMQHSTLVQPHIHFDFKYDFQSEKVFICFQDFCDLTLTERALIRENVFPQLKNSPYLKINDKGDFLDIFYEIIHTRENNSLSCKSKMLCLLQAIISENAPEFFYPAPDSSATAFHIKSYIDSNYEQDIQLYTLEKQFGYSKFYIEKLFKQAYGISVINYRNHKRMDAAVNLLKEHSVSKTAQLLGFSSIYAFSRAFRSAYGASPTKFIHHKENLDH